MALRVLRSALLLALLVVLAGCPGQEAPPESAPEAEAVSSTRTKNEVVVLGTIHAYHHSSRNYSYQRLQQILRNIDPDYVMVEIPPDRLDDALQEFRVTGETTDPRVKLLLEYTGAVFPLMQELEFELIPVSAWTEQMAEDRRSKLRTWRETRAEETAEVEAARNNARELIAAGGAPDDPAWIHTDAYDELVRAGEEVYSRVFNDDLGEGGWENHNNAHWALVSEALDRHQGEGKRFVLMFASVHNYWFKEKLRQRDDIELLSAQNFLGDGS